MPPWLRGNTLGKRTKFSQALKCKVTCSSSPSSERGLMPYTSMETVSGIEAATVLHRHLYTTPRLEESNTGLGDCC